MHDFFVDRLVHTGGISKLTESVVGKAERGGGGIHGIAQQDHGGGNAVNLAHALARLGLRTLLITHADLIHERLLKNPFEGLDAEVRVKSSPPGLTVVLEGEVNLMLRDLGGAEEFGPELLDADDWKALGAAEVVCSVNWAANKKGTRLLAALRTRLGREKSIFIDPADFSDRAREFARLLALVRERRLVDWMSLNEEEALEALKILGARAKGPRDACASLFHLLRIGIDVHTARESFSCDGSKVTTVRTKKVLTHTLTGASDVWDAGSIYGRLKGLTDFDRLRFANTAAELYIAARSSAPPDLVDVLDALR